MRLLGMDARAGEDCGRLGTAAKLSGDFEGALHLVRAIADADGEDGAHTGCLRACQHSGQVVGGDHIEMSVRIGEMHGR